MSQTSHIYYIYKTSRVYCHNAELMTLQRDTDLCLSPPRGRFRVSDEQKRVCLVSGEKLGNVFNVSGSHDVTRIKTHLKYKVH